ncbi:MAG: hypothetical protein LBT80_04885 [Lactobacillaceae bacterium]|jgi:predicted peptidase|nr:hypothetical protein [Lactobacillaceae bacterium]
MKHTSKYIVGLAVMTIGLVIPNEQSHAATNQVVTGTYTVHIGGYDWGANADKVILSLDTPVEKVNKTAFKVKETFRKTDYDKKTLPVVTATEARKITSAYLCDAAGKKVTGSSKLFALKLAVSPTAPDPILMTDETKLNTWDKPYYFTIQLAKKAKLSGADQTVTKLKLAKNPAKVTTAADMFTTDSYTAKDGVKYQYAAYNPAKNNDTLVVWLHGLGNGGTKNTDPKVALLATKEYSLASAKFQKQLGGASIFVPQCPTYWMDNDGKGTNFNKGLTHPDGTSYYEASLYEAINAYKAKIGATKVILAGASNGGYMTMLMGEHHPSDYKALVPICEAMPNKLISETGIKALASVPTFFIYAKNDTTVNPKKHEIPTIKRLKKANPVNLKVFAPAKVVDTSGKYKTASGKPYEYTGHAAWIYFENNKAFDGVSVWKWLGLLVK